MAISYETYHVKQRAQKAFERTIRNIEIATGRIQYINTIQFAQM